MTPFFLLLDFVAFVPFVVDLFSMFGCGKKAAGGDASATKGRGSSSAKSVDFM